MGVDQPILCLSGYVVDGYTYDVFGAIRSQSGTGDTDFKFSGER